MLALRILAVVLCLAGNGWPGDSSSFRGGIEHPGIYQTKPLSQLAGVKWKFHTHGLVLSSPALADGTLYVGSTDHFLYALNAATGERSGNSKRAATLSFFACSRRWCRAFSQLRRQLLRPGGKHGQIAIGSFTRRRKSAGLPQSISMALTRKMRPCPIRSMFFFPRPWSGRDPSILEAA